MTVSCELESTGVLLNETTGVLVSYATSSMVVMNFDQITVNSIRLFSAISQSESDQIINRISG